jgi:hypothetical protein
MQRILIAAVVILVACGQPGTGRSPTTPGGPATSAGIAPSPTTPGSSTGPSSASVAPRGEPSGLAFDSARGEIVFFGAVYSSAAFNGTGAPPEPGTASPETWTWKHGTWRLRSPAMSPPARTSAGMAYDESRHEVVLFGGQNAVAPVAGQGLPAMQDTWTWDGSTWTQQNPSSSPPAAVGPILAFDAKLQRVVAVISPSFGDSPTETWVWDGRNWAQLILNPAVPGPRYGQMAYDSVHGSLVIFGGHWTCSGPGQCTEDPDTWTFDGASWTRHPGSSNDPAARDFTSMATNPSNGSVLLFGGGFSNNFTVLADTWIWDGNAWTQLHPSVSPWARRGGTAVADSVDKSILLYGGGWNTQNSGSDFYDLWQWTAGSWALIQPTTTSAPADQKDAIVAAAASGRGLLPLCGQAAGACMSVDSEPQMGYYAAYVVFDLKPAQGQNVQCVSYVSRDVPIGSWTEVGVMCGPTGGRMPRLGANATVNVSGCANVRTAPQIGQVVSCLPNGTSVTIDDGPTNVQGTLWWHLAGRGWMAHQLLVA